MNTFKSIKTDYLRPSRTIETTIVSNGNKSKTFYIYNYEGYSFRVFKSHLGLTNFFQDKSESDFHFSSNTELDNFLSQVKF